MSIRLSVSGGMGSRLVLCASVDFYSNGIGIRLSELRLGIDGGFFNAETGGGFAHFVSAFMRLPTIYFAY